MKYILTITNPDLSFETTSEVTTEQYELLVHQVMKGDQGTTFIPFVSEGGIISWTNNGGRENPEPRDIRGPKGEDANLHPYTSLERLRPYLYRMTFDSLPEENREKGFTIAGCSSYVQDGRLYRNLDFKYDNAASFIIRCRNFEGMSFITGLNDGDVTDELAAELPYRVVDGRNNHGIMVSTHVIFNDWFWGGTGRKNIPLTRLPFLILSRVRSMATILTDLEGVLDNLSLPPVLSQSGYLIQVLVTDGTTTYAVLPPIASNQPFVITNITSNPKMSNFRWVADEIVDRRNLQVHPTGVERWNMMPCPLAELQFTRAYQAPTRLSEFIGIRNTTKDSTDEQLLAIYEDARQAYLTRVRNGATWHTMHSVVYGDKMESLYIQENWNDNCVGSGAGDYSELTGKPTLNGHTIEGNMSSEDLGIATRTSELENDSDFVSDENYVHTDNNYTDEDKAKVASALTSSALTPYRTASEQDVVDDALTEELDALADVVEDIEDKIPEQASSVNQLADKAFVNSSIATNTAHFRGTYDVVNDLHLTFDATEAQVAAALASVITEVTNNDYAFVVFVDSTTAMPTRYDRYKYGTQGNQWKYEYTLNNSSFTAAQWDAISSGITSGLVAKLNALPDAASLAVALLAKYEKPSSGIPKNDLSEGVKSSLDKADTALQEHQSLAAYRTASEQDTIDAGKQPLINDLVTIRSGAALGATALQSVPNTYRTAAAQDIIDNAFDSRLDALEADYAIALTLI